MSGESKPSILVMGQLTPRDETMIAAIAAGVEAGERVRQAGGHMDFADIDARLDGILERHVANEAMIARALHGDSAP